jgi:general secretion pathway protein G
MSAMLMCSACVLGNSSLDDAKHEATEIQVSELLKGLRFYRQYLGRYPSEAQGLSVLTSSVWQGPRFSHVPADPWGHPYRYRCLHECGEIIISSDGRDGVPWSRDDIAAWGRAAGPALVGRFIP